MAVFPGRWTRGTIIDQALKKVGNQKIKSLARDRLNRILEDLYTQHEWPFLFKDVDLTVAGASFPLPDDFLRPAAERDTGLRVRRVNGTDTDTPVVEVDRVAWRRQAIPFNQTGDRPLFWYVDYTAATGLVWPVPDAPILVNLLYKQRPLDQDPTDVATYDASVPLFPWGQYLADAIECWALDYDNAGRAPMAKQDLAASLDRILNIALPPQSIPDTALLDPTVFGPGFRTEEDAL